MPKSMSNSPVPMQVSKPVSLSRKKPVSPSPMKPVSPPPMKPVSPPPMKPVVPSNNLGKTNAAANTATMPLKDYLEHQWDFQFDGKSSSSGGEKAVVAVHTNAVAPRI